jgi:hypothetical protein
MPAILLSTARRIWSGWRRLAALVLLTGTLSGCQAVVLLGYLIGGPPSSDPDFHIRTKQSLKGKNKVVLVYCYAQKELKWDNESVDYDLAKHVAHRLVQNEIKVIDPDRVHAWLDKNDKWKKTSELGKAFKVDYIVHIEVKDYGLYEPHSQNLYRGHADLIVNVVKMDEDKKDGKTIYTTTIKSHFPTRSPADSNQIPFTQFKKMYLSALSDEIGKLFYSVETGAEIPNGVMQ